MRHWFDFVHRNDGSCVLLGSVIEYDDRPGALRDQVLANETRWRNELSRAIGQAVECGHLGDGDIDKYGFEMYAIALAHNPTSRLYGHQTTRRNPDAATEARAQHQTPQATNT